MTYLTEWSPRNRGLAEGLLLYEDDLGPYGYTRRAAMDEANEGEFEVEELHDFAQQAIDEWRKDNETPEPGVVPRVVLTPRARRNNSTEDDEQA